ncbi:hypothetical protein, partial [Parafrankia sp. Ea1.12]|uniref:hypothetical protein n=1 Tax=Parafrankia sp. Ea1.12 TaxID=573499 RepID=UPI001F1850BD
DDGPGHGARRPPPAGRRAAGTMTGAIVPGLLVSMSSPWVVAAASSRHIYGLSTSGSCRPRSA